MFMYYENCSVVYIYKYIACQQILHNIIGILLLVTNTVNCVIERSREQLHTKIHTN